MPRTTISSLGALVVGGLLATSCSFDPISEVETSDARPQPETLAFTGSGDHAGTGETGGGEGDTDNGLGSRTTDPALTVPAGAWVSRPESTSVGVHSAPDPFYTRLGSLSAGDGVIATGRRVDTAGVIWMEISWNDANAWVNSAPFSRFEP